jgi:asparagine synthase (glutamine-hydrolysing)
MCGLTGFLIHPNSMPEQTVDSIIRESAKSLAHRGPDSIGLWCGENNSIAMGHRRLSIIDLSETGGQPMHSTCGRYVMVFNGEIYNFLELRKQLSSEGVEFGGHSDTRVLIEGISKWGIEKTIKKTIGMFAFAVWDKKNKSLYLCRDRLGEKPLYYGWYKGVFMFASELKAFKAWPGFKPELDIEALTDFFQYSYVPSPSCIFKGFRKLMPGSFSKVNLNSEGKLPDVNPYWSLQEVVEYGEQNPIIDLNENELVNELEIRVKSAVKSCMVSDVPIGAFLSGGIDSSLVVALMQEQSINPIKTFSMGFSEDGYDESIQARAVAQHLKTEHTEMIVSSEDAMATIPLLPDIYDEPFADSSQIPTFLVAKLAGRNVKVALSGDGADELFAGYNRHVLSQKLSSGKYKIPKNIRKIAGNMLLGVSAEKWDTIYNSLARYIPANYQLRLAGEKIHKFGRVLNVNNGDELYQALTSTWLNSDIVINQNKKTMDHKVNGVLDNLGLTKMMLYNDTIKYLPDDILVKVDRACMAVSLESRIPFLDHRLIEYAWKIPLNNKVRNNQGKYLLRQVLYKHVPRELVDRPKMGFGIPLESWLRGPLKTWAEELLDSRKLKEQGLLNHTIIKQKWDEHQSGRHNWHHQLWNVIMFQAWHKRWIH